MIVVVNPDRTIDPIELGGLVITASQRPGYVYWTAHVRLGEADGPVVLTAIGAMPDSAVRQVCRDIRDLRDTCVLACIELEATGLPPRQPVELPGCDGVEMMPPLEAEPI